ITKAGADRVLAIDLHAPAIQGFFDIPVDNLTAMPILANNLFEKHFENVVVVSPDTGGVARANDFRTRVGANLAIISKHRPAPDEIAVIDMVGDVEGKVAIIVDDMISTGGTLKEAADLLHDRGAASIHVYATHGIFAGRAPDVIHQSRIDSVTVTNSIHAPPEIRNEKIHQLTIAPLLATAIRRIHEDSSVSALFKQPRFQQAELIPG
ncbi:MAG TPA: ribose-phosphate diphosphokinase, partial [Chloroflexota bacterium]|nr:ribose-phosphate diphosphokinase [Chloroflexota bacterium]